MPGDAGRCWAMLGDAGRGARGAGGADQKYRKLRRRQVPISTEINTSSAHRSFVAYCLDHFYENLNEILLNSIRYIFLNK